MRRGLVLPRAEGARTEAKQPLAAAASALIPLMRGVVPMEAATAIVDPELCAGCGMCVEVCPFGAPALDPFWGVSRVNAVLLQKTQKRT